MKSRNSIRDAVRFALIGGIAASVVNAPAVFAEEDDEARELDAIEVTGSRIKRLDVEGPSPVTVIDREQIDASGDISVADVLRESTFNSFGSFAESSGFTAQSQATISLRGVGSNRTLVLLDGRRMAGSAILDGGQTQNLNVIPLAAVERIEILRDGASAIYGTDAIGGVVNIILRDDYEGLSFSASYGRSSWGEPTESSASIVGGVSGGKGNITFSLDHQERSMFFDADRPWSQVGISPFGYPGTAIAWNSTYGTAIAPDFGSIWIPDPRCPGAGTASGLGTDAEFPNSTAGADAWAPGFCSYNYASQSATQASLRRDSLFVKADYEITSDITAFGRFTVSHNESFGRYAPAPNTFYPTVASDNPENFSNLGHALWADSQFNHPNFFTDNNNNPNNAAAYVGPFNLTMFIRMVPNGPRDSVAQDRLMDLLVGLEGYNDWFGGSEWEIGYQHSRLRVDSIGSGYGIHDLLQNAIDAGTYSPFAPIDSNGGLGDPAPFAHTIVNDSETVRTVFDAQLSFDLFEMENGPVPLVVGAEYFDDKFHSLNDAQSVAGNVFGTAGGNSDGARTNYAVYGEVLFPVMDNLEVDFALRYDRYSDFGDTINPKLAAAWRPTDDLLIRASYGEGFRAPDLAILNAVPAQSFPSAVDILACNNAINTGALTTNATTGICSARQYETLFLSNGNLQPELSESFSFGVVWNPTDDLDMGLTWYNIELGDQIANISTQQAFIFEQIVASGGGGASADLTDISAASTNPGDANYFGNRQGSTLLVANRAAVDTLVAADTFSGSNVVIIRNQASLAHLVTIAGAQNLGGLKTSGIDFEINYRFGIGDIGEFEAFGVVTHISRFDTAVLAADDPSCPFNPGLCQFGDALGFAAPDMRANVGLNWRLGDYSASLLGNYIASSTAAGTTVQLGSYTTWDLQFAWQTPWDGEVVVGARNLFDREPPVDTTGTLGHPQWSRFLHDALGRVPYIRYSQDL